MGNYKSLSQKKNNQNKTLQPSKSKQTKKKPFATIQKQGNIKSDTINGNAIKYGETYVFNDHVHSNQSKLLLLIEKYARTVKFKTENQIYTTIPSTVIELIAKFHGGCKYDTIIYLSQNDDIKLHENTDINNKSLNNTIKLNKYNLKTKQMISSIEINTSKYNIDISNCVYCINTQNNSIYLIHKNTQIFTISITDNPFRKPLIKPLNVIDSENNITQIPIESKNIASIAYYNNTVTILGAISKPTNDEKSQYEDKNIGYIPFDATKIRNNHKQLAITKFGKDCSVLQIPELNRIFFFGGQAFWGKTDIYIPTNVIWVCSINKNGKHKWECGPMYLPEPMHSFGIVHLNLKHYRWLLFFGGTHVHSRKDILLPMNTVYAIYFDKKYEKLSIQELIAIQRNKNSKKKNNSNGVRDIVLHGLWIELCVHLPEKANYCCFYDEKLDKDLIHLISRKSGNHYTIGVSEVLQLLDKNKLFTKDGMNGTVHKCHPWAEGGKQVIPTKLAKLKGKGPTIKTKGKMIIGRKMEEAEHQTQKEEKDIDQ